MDGRVQVTKYSKTQYPHFEYGIYRMALDCNFMYYTTFAGTARKMNLNDISKNDFLIPASIERWFVGIVWNGKNVLYLCDCKGRKIFSYSIDTGEYKVVAGTNHKKHIDGNLSEASFCNPQGIAIDSCGDLYIADDGAIRKLSFSQGTVSTIAGGISSYNSICLTTEGLIISVKACNPFLGTTAAIKKVNFTDQNKNVSVIAGSMYWDDFWNPHKEILKEPVEVYQMSNGNLLVADLQKPVLVLSIKQKTISSWTLPEIVNLQASCFFQKDQVLWIGTSNALYKVELIWMQERLLWIGKLKEDASYCNLARLPREIVREVLSHLPGRTSKLTQISTLY